MSTHPGRVLFKEYVEPQGISQREFARRLGLSAAMVSGVINGRRPVSARFALLLEKELGVKAIYWMTLQAEYNLQVERRSCS